MDSQNTCGHEIKMVSGFCFGFPICHFFFTEYLLRVLAYDVSFQTQLNKNIADVVYNPVRYYRRQYSQPDYHRRMTKKEPDKNHLNRKRRCIEMERPPTNFVR